MFSSKVPGKPVKDVGGMGGDKTVVELDAFLAPEDINPSRQQPPTPGKRPSETLEEELIVLEAEIVPDPTAFTKPARLPGSGGLTPTLGGREAVELDDGKGGKRKAGGARRPSVKMGGVTDVYDPPPKVRLFHSPSTNLFLDSGWRDLAK